MYENHQALVNSQKKIVTTFASQCERIEEIGKGKNNVAYKDLES